MFELIENVPSNAVIKVIGVGGGGGNAVKHMIATRSSKAARTTSATKLAREDFRNASG